MGKIKEEQLIGAIFPKDDDNCTDITQKYILIPLEDLEFIVLSHIENSLSFEDLYEGAVQDTLQFEETMQRWTEKLRDIISQAGLVRDYKI